MKKCNCPGCIRERNNLGGYQPCSKNNKTPKQEKRVVATVRQAYPELEKLCGYLGIDISKATSVSIHFDIEGGITYDLNAYATLASNTGSN